MAAKKFGHWTDPGTALITGASSGLGAEFARQLSARGFGLVLVARREDLLEQLAQELRERTHFAVDVLAADLGQQAGVDRVVERIRSTKNLDVLVNNAGFGIPGGFADCDFDRMIEMMTVHMIAPVYLTRAAIPVMAARDRGAIVNTASLAAFNPSGGMYSPTKAFLVSLSEGLAMELHANHILVQALCPGFTHTGFHDTSPELGKFKENVPKVAWGSAGHVVKASLSGLAKGKIIVIPGLVNKFIMIIPHNLRKRVSGNWRRGEAREPAPG